MQFIFKKDGNGYRLFFMKTPDKDIVNERIEMSLFADGIFVSLDDLCCTFKVDNLYTTNQIAFLINVLFRLFGNDFVKIDESSVVVKIDV